MATIEQQTFIDRLNNAENALGELANYAENLANRLVGYADEAEPGYPDSLPASGFLPCVGDAAGRMERKVEAIRRNLRRVSESLPAEAINMANHVTSSTGGKAVDKVW